MCHVCVLKLEKKDVHEEFSRLTVVDFPHSNRGIVSVYDYYFRIRMPAASQFDKKDILKCFSGGSLPPEGLPFISRPCGTAYGKSRRHCNTGSRGQDQDRDRLRDPIHLQLGAGAVLDH
jgi:hypothetical protein